MGAAQVNLGLKQFFFLPGHGYRIFLFLGSGRLQGAHIRQVGVAWTILDFKNVSDPGSSSLRTFWSLFFFFFVLGSA